MRDPDENPTQTVNGHADSVLPKKRCQSCGCWMWVGVLRCPLCDAPMHFGGRGESTDAPTDKVVKVVVFSLTHFEPAPKKRRRPFGEWLLRGFGVSELSVREFLIRLTLATAVVALFVAGLNLL